MRQARSDVTRGRIVAAATELFNAAGYAAVGLGDVIGRAGITKGAFYYHFESKSALALAVVEQGAEAVTASFAGPPRASTPALEDLIQGAFVVARRILDDPASRAAFQLVTSLGGFDERVALTYRDWLAAVTARVSDAIAEGDIRDDVDPTDVAQTLFEVASGIGVLASIEPGEPETLVRRVVRSWEWVLPAVTSPDALPYFLEYLSREAVRRDHDARR